MGAPNNVLPASVDLALVLGRSVDAVVYLHNVLVYPTGISFSLAVRTRASDMQFDPLEPLPFGPLHHLAGRGAQLPDSLLRFGVQLADGGKATNLGMHFPPDPLGHEPDGPVLMPGGGGGGSGSWDLSYWLWPLPPAGPLTFVCEWPAHDIALTEATVDAETFRAAAARSEVLWPASDGGSGRAFRSYGG